ncbi:MAG TPA: quinolinate synthase NadA [Chitinophagaceae bacterium]|nr:quinolinate synthase NadA [Chitinophagaceae bacterium]
MAEVIAEEVSLHQKIRDLAKEKNALLLAHYYQRDEIQEVADFVGDSLGLARKAKETDNEIIVFAGVKFMAETAKIVNPEKRVFLPDLDAGCSLADNCTPEAFGAFLKKYPDHLVITYVNTSAEIKAMSDIICTSSNAESIVRQIPEEQKIVFAPDANLGKYIMKQTGRDMVLWDGSCIVHEAFSVDKLMNLMKLYPDADLIAHPESESHILNISNFVGSTSKLINYVKESNTTTFIVGTEAGILKKMQEAAPDKTLIAAPAKEDNNCNCSECAFMKMNTMEKVYNCLKNESPEIFVDKDIIEKAVVPLDRMFEYS